MSTNANGTMSAGGDGLGGEGDHALAPRDGGEEILEDPTYSTQPEFEIEDSTLAPPADGGSADPWEGYDEETRELAQKKGWQDPTQMAQSYRELERTLGQRGRQDSREVEELRAQLAAIQSELRSGAAASPQQSQGYQPHQDAIDELFAGVDFQQLSEVAGGDPGTALHIYQEQVMVPRLRHLLGGMAAEIMEATGQQVNQRTQPLEQGMGQIRLRDEAMAVIRDYPEDFPRLRDQVEQLYSERRELQRPGGLKAAFYEVFAQDQAKRQRQQRMASEGETLMGGRGRSAATEPPVDPRREVREAISGAMLVPRDGL